MSFAEERGRQGHVVSTGRGGAGNLVPHANQDDAVTPGAERGRELSPHPVGEVITHSGRGGAGNIRPSSHSRTRGPNGATAADAEAAKEDALQEKLVADARGRQADAAFSTGRGGVGNISRSRSRSAAGSGREGRRESRREGSQLGRREGSVHASGRGGFGNISEERNSIDLEKEAEREKYEASVLAKHNADEAAHPHPHATGKGGAGNMYVPGPNDHPDGNGTAQEDREAHAKVHAADKDHWVNTGRGGAGNMVHRKDHSPAGDERDGRGRDAHKGGMLGNVFRSISRAAGRDKSSDGRAKD
ncbi:hypothetical protein IAT38_002017 [Cryptococcus sp. DSM 104549]